MTLPKSIERWADKIDEAYHEDDNGWWVHLKRGWINGPSETHMIHEDTLRECAQQLRHDIEPCACADCRIPPPA